MTIRVFVKAEGFEPSTACLEGRCSIQLSYASINSSFVGVAGFEPAASCSQSRRDNRATLHPEVQKKRRVRDSNPWYSFPYACLANMSFRPLRQLSNEEYLFPLSGCKCNALFYISQVIDVFFLMFFNSYIKIIHYQMDRS